MKPEHPLVRQMTAGGLESVEQSLKGLKVEA